MGFASLPGRNRVGDTGVLGTEGRTVWDPGI